MTRRTLSKSQREAILEAQNGRCWVCSDELFQVYEIDHRQALIHGGDNGPDNLRALCRRCHASKTRLDVRANAKVKRLRGETKPKRKRDWPKRAFPNKLAHRSLTS